MVYNLSDHPCFKKNKKNSEEKKKLNSRMNSKKNNENEDTTTTLSPLTSLIQPIHSTISKEEENLSNLEKKLEQTPKDIDLLYKLISAERDFETMEHSIQAITYCKIILAINPQEYQSYLAMAEIHDEDLDNFEGVEQCLKKALNISDNPDTRLAIGGFYHIQGKLKQAKIHYNSAMNHGSLIGKFNVASIDLELGKNISAISKFEELRNQIHTILKNTSEKIKNKNKNKTLYNVTCIRLLNIYSDIGDLKKIELIENQLISSPYLDIDIIQNYTQISTSKFDEDVQIMLDEIPSLEAKIADDITDIESMVELAYNHTYTGNYEEGKITAKKALFLDPKNAYAMIILGNIAEYFGDLHEAEKWYLDADEIFEETKDDTALGNLSNLYEQEECYSRSQEVLEEAVKRTNCPIRKYDLSRILIYQNNPTGAIIILESAKEQIDSPKKGKEYEIDEELRIYYTDICLELVTCYEQIKQEHKANLLADEILFSNLIDRNYLYENAPSELIEHFSRD